MRKMKDDLLIVMCLSVCVYVCAPCMYLVPRSQKRAKDPLELELEIVVSCHLGAVNQTWILSVISKCF